MRHIILGTALVAMPFVAQTSAAQGQDGTRAERNLQVMATLLPGTYDNANQAYFDRRLGLSESDKHDRRSVIIEPTTDGDTAYEFEVSLSVDGAATPGETFHLVFDADDRRDTFISKAYANAASEADERQYLEGCDIIWRLEAGQYQGQQYGDCAHSHYPLHDAKEFLLSETALWIDFETDNKSHYDLERARPFSCYVDVPGVGGGRDIPYQRYEIEHIHDKGGVAWVTLDDGSEVSVRLQNIRWPMNNEEGIFTRHSFVMYIGKKVDGGEEQEISYTWTIPQAPRIGMNLKWMLANCYMISNRDVDPYFSVEPMVDLSR